VLHGLPETEIRSQRQQGDKLGAADPSVSLRHCCRLAQGGRVL